MKVERERNWRRKIECGNCGSILEITTAADFQYFRPYADPHSESQGRVFKTIPCEVCGYENELDGRHIPVEIQEDVPSHTGRLSAVKASKASKGSGLDLVK